MLKTGARCHRAYSDRIANDCRRVPLSLIQQWLLLLLVIRNSLLAWRCYSGGYLFATGRIATSVLFTCLPDVGKLSREGEGPPCVGRVTPRPPGFPCVLDARETFLYLGMA